MRRRLGRRIRRIVPVATRVRGGGARRPGALQSIHREQLCQRRRRRGRAVDDRHPLPHRRGDDRAEQWVVRAAQQQRVDPCRGRQREHELAVAVACAQQRRQLVGDGCLDLRTAQEPGFDHRHEAGRGVLVDLHGRVLILDRVEIGVRPDGRRCRDDAHPPIPCREGRRGGTRPDDAQHRQVVASAQVTQRDGRGRVARDDQCLDVAPRQLVGRLGRERPHLIVGADAVRRARVVAEVDRWTRVGSVAGSRGAPSTRPRPSRTRRWTRVGHSPGAPAVP